MNHTSRKEGNNQTNEPKLSTSFTILYQNTNGLNTKLTDFYTNVLTNNYDSILVCESWLNHTHKNSELFDDRYNVFRCDRKTQQCNKRIGGGVILAIRKKYSTVVISSDDMEIDCVIVKVMVGGCLSFYLCVTYFPPNCKCEIYNNFFQFIDTHCPEGCHILLVGDYNIPEIIGIHTNFMSSSTLCKDLYNFMSYHEMESVNDVKNHNDKTLDLVLTNIPCVSVSRETQALVPEDKHHPALLIDIQYKCARNPRTQNTVKVFHFAKANFEAIYRELAGINWDVLDKHKNVNSALGNFYDIINEIFTRHVPFKESKTHTYPCWFTPSIIRNIKLKSWHYSKWKKAIGNTSKHHDMFVKLRSTIKKEVALAFSNFIRESEESVSIDPTQIWKFVRMRSRKSVGGTLKYDQQILHKNQDIANAFAHFFQSVYKKSNINFDYDKHISINDKLDIFHLNKVSLKEIEDAIKHLKAKKSVGPDGIPPYVIKGCGEILKYPLRKIINLSLSTSIFPEKWKVSAIFPIPKESSANQITNFRPIALLSAPAKIYEYIIYKRLLTHIQPLISKYQHGFLAHRSTITNLVTVTDFIAEKLDEGGQVDIIYTDFSKAFDTVNHDILLNKLYNMNVSKSALDLMKSYLINRKQYVTYHGYTSDSFNVMSGVPQGSNLGPLLFLIHINDLPETLSNSNKLLFADDLKIYKSIRSINDCRDLQEEINNLVSWCVTNDLSLNIRKCSVVTYTKRKTPYDYQYKIVNETINRVNVVKDLGVMYDSQLTFTKHLDYTINQAHRNLGYMLRITREFRNPNPLISLYNLYVRSKLEYASSIWAPNLETHKRKLEAIQSKFLKVLAYRQTKLYPRFDAYESLLTNYGITSLEQRRQINDIMFLYKILNNHVNDTTLVSKIGLCIPTGKTRIGNSDIFYCRKRRTDILYKSPSWRMCATFNIVANHYPNVDIFYMRMHEFQNAITSAMLQITNL